MLVTVNPGANNSARVFQAETGQRRLLLQNPPDSAVTLYFHQGLPVRYGTSPVGSPGIITGLVTVEETGAAAASLAPGDSVMLHFHERPVWVHTGPVNTASSVIATPLP